MLLSSSLKVHNYIVSTLPPVGTVSIYLLYCTSLSHILQEAFPETVSNLTSSCFCSYKFDHLYWLFITSTRKYIVKVCRSHYKGDMSTRNWYLVVFLLVACAGYICIVWNPGNYSNELVDLSYYGNYNSTKSTSVDKAHRQQLPHRGVWVFIVDENNQILVIERSLRTVTCPGAWSTVGEHSHPLESYESTVYRALKEELRIERSEVSRVYVLEEQPILYRIVYSSVPRRVDVQWTQSFLVRIKQASVSASRINYEGTRLRWLNTTRAERWLAKCPQANCRLCEVVAFSKQIYHRNNSTLQSRLSTSFAEEYLGLVRKAVAIINTPHYAVSK